MKISKDKTKLTLVSSQHKRTCVKDNNLVLVSDNSDFQLTRCEKYLGIQIDDNL